MTSNASDANELETGMEEAIHPRSASEHEIRGRAYEIYLARGAQPGRDLEDWLQAERELTSE
jgi:hypothetical protein